jgi:hypothetical protein
MQSPAGELTDDVGQTSRGTGWRVPLVLFLVLFALFGLTARHGGGSWDYYTANYASWHLVHEGDPWMDGTTVPGLENDPEEFIWVREQAANGHTVIRRFPGVIAIALPAYWVADVVGASDTMTVVPGAVTAALACALGILMLFLAMRTRVRSEVAVGACAVLAFATPVWTVAADAVWPHTVSVLGLGGMAWAASRERWWLVGLFGGVVLWGRLHAAIIVAVVGLLMAWWRRSPGLALKVGAASGVLLGLVCVWTRWWIGSWNPISSYGADIFDGANAGSERYTSIVTQLISPDRGILVWTPLVILLTPALVRGWREVPDWARALLWGGVVYTLAQAWIADPTGGDSFYGYRHGIELVMAATPAYAVTIGHLGATARRWLTPVVTLQCCAMAFGAMVDVFLLKEDVWHDNAFVYALRESWPVGPTMLVGIMCIVLVVRHRLTTRAPQAVESPADIPAHAP